MDFITKLPRTVATEWGLRVYGYNDTIIASVGALTKRAHWVAATQEALTAERFAKILINSYFRLPEAIAPSQDPRFTGDFLQRPMTLWKTRARMSTAFHPQTDGHAEKASLISWNVASRQAMSRLLTLAELSYNAHTHKATNLSPFEAG